MLRWILFNPSTADEQQLDPTLRLVATFTRGWDYGCFEVLNLYALRSPLLTGRMIRNRNRQATSLDSRQPMKLTDVKGVGQSAAGKLAAAGIETVEDLAEVDLRTTDVTGLSSDHVATLRDNALTFLEAQETGDLTLVAGLGPSAAEKLRDHGAETIADLVELDLRGEDVEGLSTENLQKLKRNAESLTTTG